MGICSLILFLSYVYEAATIPFPSDCVYYETVSLFPYDRRTSVRYTGYGRRYTTYVIYSGEGYRVSEEVPTEDVASKLVLGEVPRQYDVYTVKNRIDPLLVYSINTLEEELKDSRQKPILWACFWGLLLGLSCGQVYTNWNEF